MIAIVKTLSFAIVFVLFESISVKFYHRNNSDIKMFKVLLEIVKKNPEKYSVSKEEGYELPNYYEEEKKHFSGGVLSYYHM